MNSKPLVFKTKRVSPNNFLRKSAPRSQNKIRRSQNYEQLEDHLAPLVQDLRVEKSWNGHHLRPCALAKHTTMSLNFYQLEHYQASMSGLVELKVDRGSSGSTLGS